MLRTTSLRAAAILTAALLAAPLASAVTSTWGGGTGVWSDATRWSTNPLFPCNGQGGNTYDVVLGSGTATLDLDCTVDALTQSSATLDGGFVLTVLGPVAWSGGTLGGTGTLEVGGGLTLSGPLTKSLAGSRTVVQTGGTGGWSQGSFLLGNGGATFRNEATWNITGGGRQMTDTSNTGTFRNTASGVVNVDLSNAGQTLLLSPGTLENAGTINVNLGTLDLDGSGTHTGSFAGVGTLRFTGGSQTLGAGASVTVSELEIAGATLGVDPAASFAPSNTDLVSGALDVLDAADTVTTGTATQAGGTLGGAGTFETTGSFSWTGGIMSGTGTTRVGDGLAIDGAITKSLSGSRTLVQAGGTGSWNAGAIALGNGGASFRNEATWNVTGTTRQMTDTSNTGTFRNAATGIVNVDLSAADQTLTISPGTIENLGTIDVNVGTLALDGSGTHAGSFAGVGTLRLTGGSQTLGPGASVTVSDLEVSGTSLEVDPAASFNPGNTDLLSGALDVLDAADTITSGTATQAGGTLGGAGTFETTGGFAWTGGTMGDSGTTRVGGGLSVSGALTKSLGATRTLVQAGGTSEWSQGSIALGNGGATFRNEAIWSITGSTKQMLDTSNTGTFRNAATGIVNVDLAAADQTVTISTGTVDNSGLIRVRVGTLAIADGFLQTAGALRLDGGRVQSTPLLNLSGGRLEGGGIVAGNVLLGGRLAPGVPPSLAAGQLDVQGTLALLSGSTFSVELLGATRGSQYDAVTATGNVTLGGSLEVDVAPAYRGAVGAQSFTVLEKTTGGTLTGSFANVASGGRVFTNDLDSFVVQYGAGSPAGADRVVLSQYVQFEIVSSLQVNGQAAGGTLDLEVAGVPISVATTPGQSAVQVAAAIAAAINADPTLRQLGIAATASGSTVFSNGTIVVVGDTDPGIAFGPSVPALSGAGLALLLGLLLLAARSVTRRAGAALGLLGSGFGAVALFAAIAPPTQAAETSPFGTSYTATVTNLPGSATGPLPFDGLPKPLGSSGLVVREKATSFGAYQLLEFSLRTADGDGFVGQQSDPMAPASVSVANLQWSKATEDPENPEEPTPARAEAGSGFLWLSIDGEPQPLSDAAGLGLRFGTHPLDASIPIVYIDNVATTELGFDTFGETAFATFTALVGAILAPQVDGIHLGVAAAPVPEPGVGIALVGGCIGLGALAKRRRPTTRTCHRWERKPMEILRLVFGTARRSFFYLLLAGASCISLTGCPEGNLAVRINGNGGISQNCFTREGEPLECPDIFGGDDLINCIEAFPSSSFLEWSGSECDCGVNESAAVACQEPYQCEVAADTRSGVRTCVANFCTVSTLSVEIDGVGRVDSVPDGLSCEGNVCTTTFCNGADATPAAVVALTPTPRPGSGTFFDGWTGDPDCEDGVVTMTAARSCTARFRQPVVSVSVTGAGRVTLPGSPAGTSCREGSPSEQCEASVPLGPETQLVALADPGAAFLGWGGDEGCEGSAASLSFSVTGDRACTASFGTIALAAGRGTFEVVSIADDESLGNDQIGINASYYGFGNGWLQGSGDLSIVSFISLAPNLTTSGAGGTFLRDRNQGTTRTIRPPPSGFFPFERLGLSTDGRWAAYRRLSTRPPPQNYMGEIFWRDLSVEGEVQIVPDDPGTGIESGPNGADFWRLSGNGRFVLYEALAPSERGNLLSAREPNLIVHDSCLGTLPADGCSPRSVALAYDAAGGPLPVSFLLTLDDPPDISRDGRFVLFRAWTSANYEATDLFLLDRDTDDDGLYDEPGAIAIGSALAGTDGQLICDGHTALDASGRHVLFRSADSNLPGNDQFPSFCRAFRRDTCAGAPAGCAPSYSPLTVPEVVASTVYTATTQPLDFGASGRFVAFLTFDPLFFRTDPTPLSAPVRVVRDTCLDAPAGCTPRNLAILRADGGPIEENVFDLRLADDGSLAILEGPRGAVLPADPNSGFGEVLLAGTGFEADPGGKPTVTGRRPTSAPEDSDALLMTVSGADFVPGATLLVGLGGEARTTIFVSREKLQAWLTEADLSTAGPLTLRVRNPGGAESDPFTFTVSAGP